MSATEGFYVVGEAESGAAALDAVPELSPDLVIMDKRMPSMGGIEACRMLTERHPQLAVVIVSVEEPDSALAQSCGAAAVVRKQELTRRFLRELWGQHRRHLSESA